MIDHLDDGIQARQFGVQVDKRRWTGSIGSGAWTDDDGERYAAHLMTNPRLPHEVVVTEASGTLTFSGGSIRIRSKLTSQGAVDGYLVCPNNTGSVVLTVN